MTNQSLKTKLEEIFYNERSAMQNDYANRDSHYAKAQACQMVIDKIEAGTLTEQVKNQVIARLGIN